MNKYSYLLFDADDTLLDFEKDEKQALIKTMNSFDISIDETDVAVYSKINLSFWKKFEKGEITKEQIKIFRFIEFFNFLKIACDEEKAKKINSTYIDFLKEGGNTIEGAKEVCKALKGKGYKLYMITNGTASAQKPRLQRSGLLPCFDEVFISEELSTKKPEKEFFDIVLKKIGCVDKSKAIVIGDSLSSDIKGAENAGLDYIWYNHKKEDVPENLHAVAIVNNIKEISGIL